MIPISFVTAGLAAGAALAAIPVILHLIMRQTPKRVLFPALRLIRQRQKRSRKRLRIKNWLLLAARMALIALMALALARPRLYSKTALGDREVPTALAFVFDTSLSMSYNDQGKDRLAEAKRQALRILEKSHESSAVFVLDSSEPGVPAALSPASARKRIEGLSLHSIVVPLNEAVGQAFKAVAEVEDKQRREVYVLTDLARSAWDPNRPIENVEKGKRAKPEIAAYILRLTPKDARDAAIVSAEARAADGVATSGSSVEIRARVRASGARAVRSVEFLLARPGDPPEGLKRAEKSVDVPADGEIDVSFRTPKLAEGIQRAWLRLTGGADPLAFDDVRYLTFQVQPALKVLLVSDLAEDSIYVASALSPDALPEGEPRPYKVERALSRGLAEKLAKVDLKSYSCIYLLNVKRLSDDLWSRLDGYVREGGGLVIGLGDRIDRDNYSRDLIPGAIEKLKSLRKPTNFGKADFAHPLFRREPKLLDADLTGVPIFRYFPLTLAAKAPGTRVLLSYQDGAPALVERAFPGAATGRVLIWTTPLARRSDRRDRAAWNEFPLFWSFLELNDQTVPYLAGLAAKRLNYEAGETVVLPLDPSRRFSNYLVEAPNKAGSATYSPPPTASALEVESPAVLGHWTVTAAGTGNQSTVLGFSVNFPSDEARPAPLEERELNALFGGKDRYVLADDPETLNRAVATTRIGHEMFPWLMFLILILVTAENTLANRFYRERPAAAGAAA